MHVRQWFGQSVVNVPVSAGDRLSAEAAFDDARRWKESTLQCSLPAKVVISTMPWPVCHASSSRLYTPEWHI